MNWRMANGAAVAFGLGALAGVFAAHRSLWFVVPHLVGAAWCLYVGHEAAGE